MIDPLTPFREAVFQVLGKEVVLGSPPDGYGDFSVSKLDDITLDKACAFVPNRFLSKRLLIGPFVNFHVDSKTLAELTLDIVRTRDEKYGWCDSNGKRAIVEHTSANPTGPLHVGRLRNSIIGDAMARLLKAAGYDVETHYYVNDLGLQAAILSWGVSHSLSYPDAFAAFTNQPQIKDEIYRLMLSAEQGNTDVIQFACKNVVDSIVSSLRQLGITFDKFVWESSFLKDGSTNRIIDKLKSSSLASQENGAWQLDLSDSKYGIHGKEAKMVFVRQNGSSLYITRDIAYHISKFASSDIVINVLGEDHKHESHLLFIALNIVGESRTPVVLFYSFVTLADGKMSTRKGNSILLNDLVNEAVIRAKNVVDEKRPSLDDVKRAEIARAIGNAAVRYNILRIHPSKPITFRWEDALNLKGVSAPFLQYAHSRCCSMLKDQNLKVGNPHLLTTPHEHNLLWKIASFPSEVQFAATHYEPHRIPVFAHSIGSTFNGFYEQIPVLKAESEELRNARLLLVDATRITIANALQLMSIEALKEM